MNEKKQTRTPTKEKKSTSAVKKTRASSGKKVRSGSKKNPKGTAMQMSEFDLSAYVSQSTSIKKRVSKEEVTPKKLKFPSKANDKNQGIKATEKDTENSTQKSRKKVKKPLKIIFLGGVGEIGKNMTALEYEKDVIVIDAGLTFPNSEDMPGIDSVVPDVTYLAQNKDKIRAVILTHGHEDHIGGITYLLKEINEQTPIYGTKLTLMLVDNKLQEHRITSSVQRVVTAGEKVQLGAFNVEFINVNHSISGACALAIQTPVGLVYHSGDFKIDLTPVAGDPIDFKRIAELGKQGVLLYMGESTNIERAGYTMSETVVGTTLDHLFSENINRRIIIATFASNVHRLQQIVDLAVKYRRKIALSGRSMFKVVDAAVKIGELKIPEGVLIDIERTKNLFDGELLVLSTGSQGEPMSALTRMSSGDFNKLTIGANDTIIISANPIPGNEKMIYRVINNLYRKGARVVYESLEKIHVSGHACQEEHKILHSLLKPKFFIPVHGEYRHLKRHAQLAETLGMQAQNILITEIGNCVELTDSEIKLGENVPAGTLLVDGEGFEDYGTSEVMKQRIKMAADGVFSVSLAVSGNYIVGEPTIESYGFMYTDNTGDVNDLKALVSYAVQSYAFENEPKQELSLYIRKVLKNHFYKTTKQSPLLIVSVVEL